MTDGRCPFNEGAVAPPVPADFGADWRHDEQ